MKRNTERVYRPTRIFGKLAIALVLGLLVVGSGRPARAADEIVIGASVPLSGPLAGFGSYEQWGYKRAVDEVNRAGGITVDGKKKVKLIIRDDKTDPNVTASNTETLIGRDGAIAMLGSCTPPLVNAGALVAERRKFRLLRLARRWSRSRRRTNGSTPGTCSSTSRILHRRHSS